MIEVKHVVKKYGRKRVLDGISFNIEKGQITCLIGVNGVGKTTILNAIMHLVPIQNGEIFIDGETWSPAIYNKVAFIPDAAIMLPSMRIEQAMKYMKDYHSVWNDARAEELLEFFRLDRKDKISTLSKGNVAKVNLLLGLALDVDYLLMDEPFSGIDVFTREKITEVFTSHLVEDRGVLITTHEIHDIENILDTALLMDEGKIVKEFNAEEMRETEGKSVVDVMREVYVK